MESSSGSNATVTNCIFSENKAEFGGGMYNNSNSTLINCTFQGNTASWGVALCNYACEPILANCILWDGGGEIGNHGGAAITITYSDVQGGWPGTGNIDTDPMFADPAAGDLHLFPDSPCINAGDDSAVPAWITTDLDGNPRFLGTVDMGVYESDYDNTPPVTTISLLGTPGNDSWYTSDVEVTLNATDEESGVAETIYSFDSITWSDYTGPFTITDEGTTTIYYGSMDNVGNIEEPKVETIQIDKTAPEITIDSPAQSDTYPVGLTLQFSADDTVSGILDFCGELSDPMGYFEEIEPGFVPAPGVYTLEVIAEDVAGNDASESVLFVVYDPQDGFVTGGGWIYSEPGAYFQDETLEGKANFGFVSKYKKGATVPTGNTEFVFKAGDLNFHSSSYDWLVVTGSNYARFKGWGSINGEDGYRFMLWAGDDSVDTFRIRIWVEDDIGNEYDVYDNGFDQEIMGGNIIIHTK